MAQGDVSWIIYYMPFTMAYLQAAAKNHQFPYHVKHGCAASSATPEVSKRAQPLYRAQSGLISFAGDKDDYTRWDMAIISGVIVHCLPAPMKWLTAYEYLQYCLKRPKPVAISHFERALHDEICEMVAPAIFYFAERVCSARTSHVEMPTNAK